MRYYLLVEFSKMAVNESRFDVLYFCQNYQMEKNASTQSQRI